MIRQKLLFMMIALIVALILMSGCGILGNIVTTPTPTLTNTSTSTSTPLPTDTPTLTLTSTPSLTPSSTPTAIPTDTPTVTSTSRPDFSAVVLTVDDLPSGFEAISLDELGFTPEDLSDEEFTVESSFAFLEAERFEIIMGFAISLQTRLDQAAFDLGLSQPDFMTEAFLEGMGAVEVLEQMELPLSAVGDASAGSTLVVDMEGLPMRIDIGIFRRDKLGAFAIVMYLDGDDPVVTIEEVAGIFDDRIIEMLSLSE